jgi:hypothetical protein
VTVNGVRFDGPAFAAAQKACKQFFPGGNGHPPPLSATQRARALRFAQCMREHGVPSFPDPIFPRSGGIVIHANRAAFDPQSPAFQQAQAACGRKP